MNDKLFTLQDKRILEKARTTYGPHKQIGVAAEECTELAKELIKAFRYDNFDDAVKNTKNNVTDEVADMFIVMDHILTLYGITRDDLIPYIDNKLERLNYWLNQSNSIEFTTKCREVPHTKPAPSNTPTEDLQKEGKNVYANEFLRLFDMNDEEYRKANE